MGGTHSIECNSAAKDIWQFCIEREAWISAANNKDWDCYG